jgi:hypothetical protein
MHFDEAIADFTEASNALSAAFEIARNVRSADRERAADASRALVQAASTARKAAQKVDARYSGAGNAIDAAALAAVLTANAYDDTANAAFSAAGAFDVAARAAISVFPKDNFPRFHAARCYTDAASMLHTAARTYAAIAFSSEVAE